MNWALFPWIFAKKRSLSWLLAKRTIYLISKLFFGLRLPDLR